MDLHDMFLVLFRRKIFAKRTGGFVYRPVEVLPPAEIVSRSCNRGGYGMTVTYYGDCADCFDGNERTYYGLRWDNVTGGGAEAWAYAQIMANRVAEWDIEAVVGVYESVLGYVELWTTQDGSSWSKVKENPIEGDWQNWTVTGIQALGVRVRVYQWWNWTAQAIIREVKVLGLE